MTVEQKKESFLNKLNQIQKTHKEANEKSIQQMYSWFQGKFNFDSIKDPVNHFNQLDQLIKKSRPAFNLQVDFSGDERLRELDRQFIQMFALEKYFSSNALDYPTVYCETLEEFFTPILNTQPSSDMAKKQELEEMIKEAQQTAKESNGGGVFGFNLPGVGCFLNGWLLSYGRNIHPKQALDDPKLLRRILSVAAHEKLGHGFIASYTSLGRTKQSLGRSLLEISERFGLTPAQSAADRLRLAQAGFMSYISQLMEEGWATWIETYLSKIVLGIGQHPRHSLTLIANAIKELPKDMDHREEAQQSLFASLEVIFGDETYPDYVILEVVKVIHALSYKLDDHFSSYLGQPLKYALGELIMMLAETNLGEKNVMYATVIAGSVDLDPTQVSLADLRQLVSNDPRLNPDARIIMISRLKLKTENDVRELASQARNVWSLQMPSELNR